MSDIYESTGKKSETSAGPSRPSMQRSGPRTYGGGGHGGGGQGRGGPRGGSNSGGPGGMQKRRPLRRGFRRRKVCRFCVDKVVYIDYKNYRLLRDFLTERGKIMPRRITGNCAGHQRMLTRAIKQSRNIALLSFTRR